MRKWMMLLLSSSHFALTAFRSLRCELKITSLTAPDSGTSRDSKSEQCCQQAVALGTAGLQMNLLINWNVFITRLKANLSITYS